MAVVRVGGKCFKMGFAVRWVFYRQIPEVAVSIPMELPKFVDHDTNNGVAPKSRWTHPPEL